VRVHPARRRWPALPHPRAELQRDPHGASRDAQGPPAAAGLPGLFGLVPLGRTR